MTIPDDVLRFIAEHVRSNVRELEGCIIKLLLYASLKHKEVSIELAREALSDKIRPGEEASAAPKALPSINKVQEVVARRWGVTPGGAPLQGADQDAHGAAADRDVSRARAAGDAAGRDRPGLRRARSLDRDSQRGQGEPADVARSRAFASGWSTRARSCAQNNPRAIARAVGTLDRRGDVGTRVRPHRTHGVDTAEER